MVPSVTIFTKRAQNRLDRIDSNQRFDHREGRNSPARLSRAQTVPRAEKGTVRLRALNEPENCPIFRANRRKARNFRFKSGEDH